MKTHSTLSLFVAGTAIALSSSAEAGSTHGHCCKIKKAKPAPNVHHHKVRHHTCTLRTTCHRGKQHQPRQKPRVRPVHNPAAPFHIKPCHPCSFKPLHIHHDPSHWYNKLADLA